jgi:hypothetical protein
MHGMIRYGMVRYGTGIGPRRTVSLPYRTGTVPYRDLIVLVERQAIIFQPGYATYVSRDAECGEFKGVRLKCLLWPVDELGYEAVNMGMGCEPPFRVFVHNTCEVINSHLCGSISHGG